MIGRFRKSGGSGNWGGSGKLGIPEKYGGSGKLGDSEGWENSINWRQSLYVVKIKNLLVPQKTRELGRYSGLGRLERFRRFGEFRRLERLGDSGGWKIPETGEKSLHLAKIKNPLEPRRIWEIGSLRRLGDWRL